MICFKKNKKAKTVNYLLSFLLLSLIIISCSLKTQKKPTLQTDNNGYAVLSDEQVENIVKRAYQYIALYNVNNKFAITQGGWNTLYADTQLKDHTMQDIARPNNDSFYASIMLDLRKDAYVVNLPRFNSKYVSLMVTAYDHYVHVPKSTRLNDFQKEEKIVFYSERTENYNGEAIEGVDEIFEANGDFISVIFRIMPHANEAEIHAKIIDQMSQISMSSLSEYQGNTAIKEDQVDFPEVGETDFDIFENNFLEVMQFIFNHLSFDPNIEMDKQVLACFEPLGIVPGKKYDPHTSIKINGKQFRAMAEKVHRENLNHLSDPNMAINLGPRIFRPKGETDLEAILAVSVIGPIGLPLVEAYYPSINTTNGDQMNAKHDYIIKMTKDELPPAIAFWSLTLYDKANGFFIPNKYKKYSVGENAGMKLNKDGGIEIYVAAEQPAGVPLENWLPINRGDEDLDIILRVYVPELDKLPEWTPPLAQLIK